MKVRVIFYPLNKSIIILLNHGLLVFSTTGEIMRYTKFLINWLHGASLWLDHEYPIYAIDIHKVIGLSAYGFDVHSAKFQKTTKRGKKTGENNLYKKYGTTEKGQGDVLDMINNMPIRGCYYSYHH